MIQVTLNYQNYYLQHRIVLEDFSIGMPEPKFIKVSVPGRDGDLDMSEALTGYTQYHNREIQLQFGITGSEAECEIKKQVLVSGVSGKQVHVRFSHLEGYFVGRCKVETITRSHRHYTVQLTIDCQPYRLAESETSLYYSLYASPREITFMNSGMPVVPTIRTTGNAVVVYKGNRYNLETGTHRLGFVIDSGENRLTISGTGSLTLLYRKGVL
ncbi:hypothetical protein [Streptococcus suis]